MTASYWDDPTPGELEGLKRALATLGFNGESARATIVDADTWDPSTTPLPAGTFLLLSGGQLAGLVVQDIGINDQDASSKLVTWATVTHPDSGGGGGGGGDSELLPFPAAPSALKYHNPDDYTDWADKVQAVLAGTDFADYLVIGDSTAAGAGADVYSHNFVSMLTKELAKYVPAEQTWAYPHVSSSESASAGSVDTRIDTTGWVDYGFWMHPSNNPEPLSYAPCDVSCGGPATVDTLEVWTYGGDFVIKCDGTQVDAWHDDAVVTKHTVTVADGAHTFTVDVGANGIVMTMNAYCSTRKVLRVGNFGRNGATSSQFADQGHDYSTGSFTTLYNPDMTSIVLGINDFGLGGQATDVCAQQSTIINHIRAGYPFASGTKTTTRQALVHTQYPTATDPQFAGEADFAVKVDDYLVGPWHCAALDLFNDWGGSKTVNRDRFKDSAHPNADGYAISAVTVAAAVLALGVPVGG